MAPSRTQPVLTPSRLKARRRKRRLLIASGASVLVLLVCAGVVGAFYIPALRVREVHALGTQTISAEEVARVVQEALSGRVWFFFPKNNAFLYDEQDIAAVIHRKFPKVKSASIELESFHSMKITIKERTPRVLWCGEVPGPGPCFFMDDSGAVYEAAPDYSGTPYVRWFGKLPSGRVLGETFAPDAFEGLLPLVSEFEKENLQTDTVYMHDNGDVEIGYENSFTLYFTLYQKPENILKAFHAALRAPVFEKRPVSELVYLDLRYSDTRAYYKFK